MPQRVLQLALVIDRHLSELEVDELAATWNGKKDRDEGNNQDVSHARLRGAERAVARCYVTQQQQPHRKEAEQKQNRPHSRTRCHHGTPEFAIGDSAQENLKIRKRPCTEQDPRSKHTEINKNDIQAFVRALADKGGKGLFATTASFSEQAVQYARAEKIMLIDGSRLADLMIKNNFCVSVEKVFEIKSIDTESFGEYEKQ